MQFTIAQLDDAYTWLCRRRRHFPSDADIWWFRRHYPDLKTELLQEINSGLYRFSPQQKIIKSSGEVNHLWGSQVVLVMKLLAGSSTPGVCASAVKPRLMPRRNTSPF
jgi:RNA-directed DNA polymerase